METSDGVTAQRLMRLVEALEDGWVSDGQGGFRCVANCGYRPNDAQYPKLWDLGLHFDDCPFHAARRHVRALLESREEQERG